MSETQKKKLTKGATTAIVVALIVLILAFGGLGYGLAKLNASVNVGGTINFTAENIYATVSAGKFKGGTLANADTKLQAVTFDMNTDPEGSVADAALETWQGLDISFANTGADVSISFRVTNNHKESNLSLVVTNIGGTFNNVTYSITINREAATSAVLATNGIYADVVITFSVTDKNASASVSDFTFPFYLENTDDTATITENIFTYELTEDGSGVYFGEWPQTIAAAGVTFSDSADADGYYLGSDGERYAKLVVDYNSLYGDDVEIVTSTGMNVASDGTSMTDGNTYYFKVEKLLWEIIDENKSTNVATIVCTSILQSQMYQGSYTSSEGSYYVTDDQGEIVTDSQGNKIYANNYEYSQLRKFLTTSFYEHAFNDLQEELIQLITVDNSATSTNSTTNQYACNNTQDYVWALSYAEVENLVESGKWSQTDLLVATTDYAKATGALTTTENFCSLQNMTTYVILTEVFGQTGVAEDATYQTVTTEQQALLDAFYSAGGWWLRSPFSTGSISAYVVLSGILVNCYVYNPLTGVVPALQIQL